MGQYRFQLEFIALFISLIAQAAIVYYAEKEIK